MFFAGYSKLLCTALRNSNFSAVIMAVLCHRRRRNETKAVKQCLSILFEHQTSALLISRVNRIRPLVNVFSEHVKESQDLACI